jgi:hypothetical protein
VSFVRFHCAASQGYFASEYNNQSLVQIRWISTQNSGGGSHSFAIDNLSITNEATPLVNDTDYPKISNILSNDFDF